MSHRVLVAIPTTVATLMFTHLTVAEATTAAHNNDDREGAETDQARPDADDSEAAPADDPAEEQGYEPDQHGFDSEDDDTSDADEASGDPTDEALDLDSVEFETESTLEQGDSIPESENFSNPTTERGEAPRWHWWLGAQLGLTSLHPSLLSGSTLTANGNSTLPSLTLSGGIAKRHHVLALDYTGGIGEFAWNAASLAYARAWGERWRPWLGLHAGYAWAVDVPVAPEATALVHGPLFGTKLGLGYQLHPAIEVGLAGEADLWWSGRRAVECDLCTAGEADDQSGLGTILRYGLDLKYTF